MEEVSQSHSTDFKMWGQNQTLTFQGISKIKEKNMIVSEKKKKILGTGKNQLKFDLDSLQDRILYQPP